MDDFSLSLSLSPRTDDVKDVRHRENFRNGVGGWGGGGGGEGGDCRVTARRVSFCEWGTFVKCL